MSSIKSILVHVDPDARTAARLALAQTLAAAHGAELGACYAIVPRSLRSAMALAEDSMASGVLQEFDDTDRSAARTLVEQANRLAAPGASWSEADREAPADAVVRRALCADLVVLGQRNPEDAGALPGDFIATVVLGSGRPALVVPYAGHHAHGRRVVVAWKPTREAARAVTAALPLLQRAEHVSLVIADRDAHGSGVDIERYLRAHGIAVETQRAFAESGEVGDRLLSLAADVNADLLVMGCYGHSRLREYVLGGATRTVLASMTLPVLMAH